MLRLPSPFTTTCTILSPPSNLPCYLCKFIVPHDVQHEKRTQNYKSYKFDVANTTIKGSFLGSLSSLWIYSMNNIYEHVNLQRLVQTLINTKSVNNNRQNYLEPELKMSTKWTTKFQFISEAMKLKGDERKIIYMFFLGMPFSFFPESSIFWVQYTW